jgi:translation initiation factor RLI1
MWETRFYPKKTVCPRCGSAEYYAKIFPNGLGPPIITEGECVGCQGKFPYDAIEQYLTTVPTHLSQTTPKSDDTG